MEKVRRFLVIFIVFGFIICGLIYNELPDDKFHIWFLDIGQGDSVLIKTPESHYILVDGGPKNKVMQELPEVMPYFVKEIDFMVLTHPHADHLEGLLEVLKRYKVKGVLMSGVNFNGSAYNEFLKEVYLQEIPFWIAEGKTDFRFGEVFLDVIFPFEQVLFEDFKNLNNSSVAMKVIYKDLKILLTGDLEEEAERELASNPYLDLRANIFKAGHHGSRTSSTLPLIRKVKPEVVVIQSGKENSYKHPHNQSLRLFRQMGVEIKRNDLEGRIEFVY